MCSYGFHTGYPTILCHQGDAVAGGQARLYYGDHPSAEGTREFAFRPITFRRDGALHVSWALQRVHELHKLL